ncbi:MAG TPA: serine/threonine-protein kinase [Micropepsaceae bacterium]|nr:serine/threonine-protein kinase [Micropepsaceae bacterium]
MAEPKHDPTVFIPGGAAAAKPAADDDWFAGAAPAAPAARPQSPPPPAAPARPTAEDDWFTGGPSSPPTAAPQSAAPSVWDEKPAVETDWSSGASSAPAPAPPGGDRTVFAQTRPATATPQPATAFTAAPAPVSAGGPARIREGSTLNNSYRITRHIADGGMGGVYEALELITGNKVAIKVIRSEFAANPTYRDLLVKEAQVLSQLFHPGLAHYRMCSHDQEYDALYIVMDFVEGTSLSDELSTLKPDAAGLIKLIRRLAAALGAAHEVNVVHRDISPDNILIPPGGLDQAQIIDFGIAKDLGGGGKTIIGDGFAGKLRYVAPEQFAEGGSGPNAVVGPWTDVYSLGLVILAIALGRAPPMGDTLFEAIERRRSVPDISAVPPRLQPVLRGMLAPEATKRLRSMAGVIAELDRIDGGGSAAVKTGLPKPVLFGGIAAVAAAAVIGAVVLVTRPNPAPPQIATVPSATTVPIVDAASVVAPVLNTLPCSWATAGAGTGAQNLRLAGLAGDPDAAAAQVQARAGGNVTIDRTGLFRVAPAACSVLEAFRKIREPATGAPSLSVATTEFRFGDDQKLCPTQSPRPGAPPLRQARVDVDVNAPSGDFTLIALEPSGKMQQLVPSRAAFEQAPNVENRGPGAYRFSFCADEESVRASPDGLAALVLLNGKPPFSINLNQQDTAAVADNWPAQFSQTAAANGWTSQLVWYRVH